METFSALLAVCASNSPVTGEFPSQTPVTQSSDVFFDLRFYKRVSKQSLDWWFETPACSLPSRCHCYAIQCWHVKNWHRWLSARLRWLQCVSKDMINHGSSTPITVMQISYAFSFKKQCIFISSYCGLDTGDIKNNAWVTCIAIFGSRVRWFANDFHEWRGHEWKSLANRLTSDPKIVIHGNECIILFLTRYLMSGTHNSAKTIIDRWFSHCH